MADNPNARPGVYPKADKANVYGEAFDKFYEAWERYGTLEKAWPSYCRIRSWAVPRAKRDASFKEWYDAFLQSLPSNKITTLEQCDRIIYEMTAAFERLHMWDYDNAPHYEDGLLEP